jgi:hypothetical protein
MSNALDAARQTPDAFTWNREADHRIANSLAVISGLVRVRARADQGHADETFLLEIADRIDTVPNCTASSPTRIRMPSNFTYICKKSARG